jgi:DnaK suppressor protein
MWMTREEIAETLGIVPNSVRGKVQKGQIERKIEDGQNLYKIVDMKLLRREARIKTQSSQAVPEDRAPEIERPKPAPIVAPRREPMRFTEPDFSDIPEDRPVEVRRPVNDKGGVFDPKQVLLSQIASLKIDRTIDAIEKGDEIDLATGEISRDLDAKISQRSARQLKEIEDALERIKFGEYGICEECGEPIPEARLRLFPAARFCVRCQEDMDQLEKLKETQGPRGAAWREEPVEGYAKTFED